ncbi:hypothetical protein LOC59_07395 [Arthrobacter sp. zg-Y916]|uniref:hypothetical protein n=1 Tax=Arthrobacter sp. zg-Y916 TaxID=2894190 RepID=UPI001E34BE2C|nr:hypothetical protein [Arthrobacter sp. zg-Y916]MCC9193472.1 hypothetical protein [Arthrobacter sp. zg-Y916]
MSRRVIPSSRRLTAVFLAALLAPAAAACGPTAEQVARQEAGTSAVPAVTPAPQQPRIRTAEPEPSPSPSETMSVGVSGAQASMAQDVQDACQWLLRRDPGPYPANQSGDCLAAAMVAGTGAVQSVSTTASWLPPGTYSMDFSTSPEFAMELTSADSALEISVGGGVRTLRTGEGASVTANASGSPEEAYAAILVDAAELTSNPDRVRGLLESANAAAVEYDAVYEGTQATRLTAVVEADEPGGFSGSLVLVLDDLYRPLAIEYVGKTRGIDSAIRAKITGWEAGTEPR